MLSPARGASQSEGSRAASFNGRLLAELRRPPARPPRTEYKGIEESGRTRNELNEVSGVDRRVDRVGKVGHEADVHADAEADARHAVRDRQQPRDLGLVDGEVRGRRPGEALAVEERGIVGDREVLDGRGGLRSRRRRRRPRRRREERPASAGEGDPSAPLPLASLDVHKRRNG